nr:reverse transcriptase domain-containing protein [Tanacetum cinerariifolium]
MSSPDHSTSNNEDAFSSNIPDYISTIPDYSPASSGKTYSNALNNSISKIPPEFLPFYNMKDIQAFYAKELPIPPPVILPPSLVLSQSPISDSQDLFPSEEISPKDTETFVSPSSSVGSSLPIMSTISPLDYPFDEYIFAELDNSLWITPRPLGEEPVPEELNDKCVEEDRVTFTTSTLTNDALSLWNAYAQPIGIEQANNITWAELKRLLTNKYYPRTEIKKMEDEFYNLTVKRNDLKTYIRRFLELATLCPNMVPNTGKLMEAFIGGLPRSIEGNVTASKPQTFEEAINIAQRLMDQIIKHNSTQDTNDHKRKFDDKNITDNNNYPNDRNNYQNNHNNHNHNNDHHQQQNRKQETFKTYVATNGKQETFKTYVATNGYTRNRPLCERCTLHHIGPCSVKCQNCNRISFRCYMYQNKGVTRRLVPKPQSLILQLLLQAQDCPPLQKQTRISQASGSGADEGIGTIPGVPDVPIEESDEEISWKSSDEGDDDDEEGSDDQDEGDDDDEQEEGNDNDQDSNAEDEEFIHPRLSIHDKEETKDVESFDPIAKTPENIDDKGDDKENLRLNVGREEGQDEEDDEDELYRDVNINLKERVVQMADVHTTQEFKDSYVTLTPVNPDGQQQSSSVSSQFVTSKLNPTPDAGIDFIFETTSQMDVQVPTILAHLPLSSPTLTPSTIATISTVPQFAGAVSSIPGIVQRYMDQQMNEAVKVAVQIQSDRLPDETQAENEEFLKNLDENIQKIIKEQVKEQVKVQVSKILPRIEQTVNEQLEAEGLTQSSNSSKISYAALVEAYESDKIILDTYGDTVTLKRRRDDDADKDEEPTAGSDRGSKRRREGKEPDSASASKEKATRSAGKSTQVSKSRQAKPSQHPEWFSQQKKPPTPDRDWNKTLPATHESIQPWISELAKQTDSRSSFNELMDTPVDFLAFLINWLKVDTLTPELLAGPTYELIKGSCKSLVELEFFLKEVYKATTDQLDWINPKGYQYPHNLLKPLPLILNSRGHCVIPFDHFINNDLEYLCGGASSRKYTTSVTKTKATNYRHIKEFACDVYSKHRIIAVTKLKIVEWHNYKCLDWIMVRRDDDKLYKFKEGDFKRLRLQDIEDMLLLPVQGKLKNLTVKESFAFNVSFRMFTRSIVFQRRVEDLQLGVESYQKKLNLTRPDTHRSDLKRKEAYITYSNLR